MKKSGQSVWSLKKKVAGSVQLHDSFPYDDDNLDRLLVDLETIRSTLSLSSPPVPQAMSMDELRRYLSIHDGEPTIESRGFMEDLTRAVAKPVVVRKNKPVVVVSKSTMILILLILFMVLFFIILSINTAIVTIVAIVTITIIIIIMIITKKDHKKYRVYFEGESDHIMKYIDLNEQYRRVDTVEDADIIIDNQFTWGSRRSRSDVQQILDEYRKMDIAVMITWITDCNDTYDVPSNVIFYKTSLFKTLSDPNEEVLAYVWESMERAPVLPRTSRPKIGFCGAAWANRKPLLDALDAHPDIDTWFIRRDSFWGGQPDGEQVKKDFRENMKANHFTVCDRGEGNFTMRFYQALSAGRIPLFVDTDMKLPYEKNIRWDDIIVRGRTPDQVIANLLVFWKERDIIKVQSDAYNLYQTHFRPEIYVNNIIHETIERVKMSSPPS